MQLSYLNINTQLLENALKITGLHSKEDVINLALAQFLQTAKQKTTISQAEENAFNITLLDEWTKSLIGLIPSNNTLEENTKQDYRDYLEKKYQ